MTDNPPRYTAQQLAAAAAMVHAHRVRADVLRPGDRVAYYCPPTVVGGPFWPFWAYVTGVVRHVSICTVTDGDGSTASVRVEVTRDPEYVIEGTDPTHVVELDPESLMMMRATALAPINGATP